MRRTSWIVICVALAACKKEEAKPAPTAPADPDEAIVRVFEEMATLAKENPTCARWADEQGRRFGAAKLVTMMERMASMEGAARETFQAKYGERVRVASALVQPFAERCVAELKALQLPALSVSPSRAPAAPACETLRLELSQAKVVLVRGGRTEIESPYGAMDAEKLDAALRVEAAKCKGDALVVADDDVRYAAVIQLMDHAVKNGFAQIALADDTGASSAPQPRPATTDLPPDNLLVITVTKTEIKIGDTTLALDAPELDRKVQTACQAALAAGKPPGMVILQADETTPANVLKAVIVGGKHAGFTNVLFAVQKRP